MTAGQSPGHFNFSCVLKSMISRSMKWSRLIVPVFLLLVCHGRAYARSFVCAESRQSATSQNEPMNFTLEGKINKVETGKFTVSSEGNIIFHVRYDDKTEIKHQDGSAGSSKDFRVGIQVKVEGDLTESGEIVARKIGIEQETESKPPASQSGITHILFDPEAPIQNRRRTSKIKIPLLTGDLQPALPQAVSEVATA